jgi:hypothetical protein
MAVLAAATAALAAATVVPAADTVALLVGIVVLATGTVGRVVGTAAAVAEEMDMPAGPLIVDMQSRYPFSREGLGDGNAAVGVD